MVPCADSGQLGEDGQIIFTEEEANKVLCVWREDECPITAISFIPPPEEEASLW
jgi:hypothetical protein